MVVRAEFPILFLHLKMLLSAQCPLSLHVFSRQVGRRCGALEVHLPQDSSCSSRLATELPAGAPEFEHVFSRQVDRRCGALEVHLPQDSSCSYRLATELTSAAPEFEGAAGAWSPLHAGRAARHL